MKATAILALAVLFGCAESPRVEPSGPPLDMGSIRLSFSAHDGAFMTGTASSLAERYTPDAVLVLPDGSTVTGATDVAEWLLSNWEEATLGIAGLQFTVTPEGASADVVLRDGTPARLDLVRTLEGDRSTALIRRMELGPAPSP